MKGRVDAIAKEQELKHGDCNVTDVDADAISFQMCKQLKFASYQVRGRSLCTISLHLVTFSCQTVAAMCSM